MKKVSSLKGVASLLLLSLGFLGFSISPSYSDEDQSQVQECSLRSERDNVGGGPDRYSVRVGDTFTEQTFSDSENLARFEQLIQMGLCKPTVVLCTLVEKERHNHQVSVDYEDVIKPASFGQAVEAFEKIVSLGVCRPSTLHCSLATDAQGLTRMTEETNTPYHTHFLSFGRPLSETILRLKKLTSIGLCRVEPQECSLSMTWGGLYSIRNQDGSLNDQRVSFDRAVEDFEKLVDGGVCKKTLDTCSVGRALFIGHFIWHGNRILTFSFSLEENLRRLEMLKLKGICQE